MRQSRSLPPGLGLWPTGSSTSWRKETVRGPGLELETSLSRQTSEPDGADFWGQKTTIALSGVSTTEHLDKVKLQAETPPSVYAFNGF